jgi:hypothetical protein
MPGTGPQCQGRMEARIAGYQVTDRSPTLHFGFQALLLVSRAGPGAEDVGTTERPPLETPLGLDDNRGL